MICQSVMRSIIHRGEKKGGRVKIIIAIKLYKEQLARGFHKS